MSPANDCWHRGPQRFGYLGQAQSSAEQAAALFAVMRPGQDRLACSPRTS